MKNHKKKGKKNFVKTSEQKIETLKKTNPWVWIVVFFLTIVVGAMFTGIFENFGNSLWKRMMYGDDTNKYVAVIISDMKDYHSTMSADFFKGFQQPEPFFNKNKNQLIEFKIKDDFFSPQRTEEITEDLLKDEDCIMIIGNSNSDLTNITLNKILKEEEDNKVSLLVPIATADNLILKSKKENYKGIIRMLPDNSKQAEAIVHFMTKHVANPNIVILEDEENAAYSASLAKSITTGLIKRNAHILLKKQYGNTNRLVDIYNTIENSKYTPNFFIYVGLAGNGLLLVEEMQTLNMNCPILLTDGCNVEDLLDRVKGKSNIYVTSAFDLSKRDLKLTFEPIGKDAVELTKKLIQELNGNVTREKLLLFLSEEKSKLPPKKLLTGLYQFDDDGNNYRMKWNVYSYSSQYPELMH